MAALRWQTVVDFVVLTAAIYLLLTWSRQARALRLALTIVLLRVAALAAAQLDLLITSWVLDGATIVALLALLVVFQPELRRALMRLDISARGGARGGGATASAAVSSAAWQLASARCGALIVLVRGDSLSELVSGGVTLDGRLSPEILISIFQKQSPVHDGAVILRDDVIVRVGAILPLTQRPQVDERYGTRHRAALGLSERSDAVVVVVSEERGEVSVMWEGQVRALATSGELEALVTDLTRGGGRRARPRGISGADVGWFALAAGLSVLVWSTTFLLPGRSVRVETVPIEFVNVPPGLTITSQSSDRVQVRLRGSEFLFDSVDVEALVERCDLAAAHAGVNTVPLDPQALDVPLGLQVEGLAPARVRVTLATQP